MFDPKHQVSGEKIQKLQSTIFYLTVKVIKKPLKLVGKLLKLPLNLVQSPKQKETKNSFPEKLSSQQLKSMDNNQKLIEQARFDKILRDRLQKKGITDAAQKVKGFRAGQNMLFTKEEFEKFGQALDETRDYIIRNPLMNTTTNNRTSNNQNQIETPPQTPKQEQKSIAEVIALKLKDKGLSNQEIDSIMVELKQHEKQKNELKINTEPIIIVLKDFKQQPKISDQVKNFFEQIGQAFKQASKNIGNIFQDKNRNIKQDLSTMSVALTSQRLLNLFGAEDGKGNRVFETNSYRIQASSSNSSRQLSVIDKAANNIILASDNRVLGRLQGNLSKQNLRDFEKLNRQLNLAIIETSRQQQQLQTKTLPSAINSINSRKNNEIER